MQKLLILSFAVLGVTVVHAADPSPRPDLALRKLEQDVGKAPSAVPFSLPPDISRALNNERSRLSLRYQALLGTTMTSQAICDSGSTARCNEVRQDLRAKTDAYKGAVQSYEDTLLVARRTQPEARIQLITPPGDIPSAIGD